MGTFTASAYRRARKPHKCDACHSRLVINPGDMYLDYRFGLYSHLAICVECSVKRRADGSKILVWDCQAARDRVRALAEQQA